MWQCREHPPGRDAQSRVSFLPRKGAIKRAGEGGEQLGTKEKDGITLFF